MKRQNHYLLFVSAPLLCLILGLLLTVSHRGMPMDPRPARLASLGGEEAHAFDAAPEVLLLAEEENAVTEAVTETLDEMRIGWMMTDRFDGTLPQTAHTVLVCTPDFSDLEGESAASLLAWVAGGGRLGVMTMPSLDGWFRIVAHKTGIVEYTNEYRIYRAFAYAPDALAVFDGLWQDEEVEDYMLPVQLETDCHVLMTAPEEGDLPLLWTREIGEGRAAVCNNTLICGKDTRGLVTLILRELEDVLVYPIINAGLIFIDDFPAPQPEGFDERLQTQYGLTTQSFFRNHWWPDMKTLARTYSLRYTGVLVETYNRTMKAPFLPDTEDNSLIRYYASELLQSGGEIGLHGYNHQPLCPDGWQYADEDYVTWESTEDMAGAVRELLRYGHSFLPDAVFTSYVPPSNYLSDEGQAVLVANVPTLVTISGVYLPEEGVAARVQEYHENPDGTVPVPRISSGFSMDPYVKAVAAGELSLHGIFSHFIHPDDVLDEERGALLGWETLRGDFEDVLYELQEVYPALRWCTATEAAGAVQRYDRVRLTRRWEGDTLVVGLRNFYDEVWLCLSSAETPDAVEGAEIYEAGGCLWLRAVRDEVRLSWRRDG